MFYLCFKFLFARKINLFLIILISGCLGCLVMVDSVAHGFSKITAKQSRSAFGDIVIDLAEKTLGISDIELLKQEAMNVEGVAAVAPFIKGRVFYQDMNEVDQAALVYGFSWPDENQVSTLHEKMSEGVVLPESLGRFTQKGAIFGSANSYFDFGELVTLYSREGPMTVEVRGYFKTGISELDFTGIIVSLETAQTMFGAAEYEPEEYRKMATGLRIKVADGYSIESVMYNLNKKFMFVRGSDEYSFFNIRSYRDMNSIEIKAMESYERIIKIILGVMLFMITMSVFIPVQTMVYEKQKDIGILRALGATKGFIFITFVTLGASLGLISTFVGLPFGVALTQYINPFLEAIDYKPFPEDVFYVDKLPTELHQEGVFYLAIFINVVSILASVIPAIRASCLTPIETIRNKE